MADVAGMDKVVGAIEDFRKKIGERPRRFRGEPPRPGGEHGFRILPGEHAAPAFRLRGGQEIGQKIDDFLPFPAEFLGIEGFGQQAFVGGHDNGPYRAVERGYYTRIAGAAAPRVLEPPRRAVLRFRRENLGGGDHL